jgi:tetratricopeptide (TPR) repeat protein
MIRMSIVRRLILGACVAALVAAASPAFAQGAPAAAGAGGSIKGKVFDPDGKPAANAQLLIIAKDPSKGPFLASTGADGTFTQGVPAGSYTITAKNGKGYAEKKEAVAVNAGDKADAGDIKLRPGSASDLTKFDEATKALIAKHNEKVAKTQAAVTAADTARDAGNFDDAITKYTDVAGIIDNCSLCYVRIGDIYRDHKDDLANAEKSYLKAIELSDAGGATDGLVRSGAYNGLAGIYNKQKKFDDASKMSAKAAEASSTAEGGGDPTAFYNAGVSLWNAQKFPEAQAQFEKAVKLDPKNAEAFYYLAMCQVNQNKQTDAKANLQMYLKLAPDGPNAATAKAILDSIK